MLIKGHSHTSDLLCQPLAILFQEKRSEKQSPGMLLINYFWPHLTHQADGKKQLRTEQTPLCHQYFPFFSLLFPFLKSFERQRESSFPLIQTQNTYTYILPAPTTGSACKLMSLQKPTGADYKHLFACLYRTSVMARAGAEPTPGVRDTRDLPCELQECWSLSHPCCLPGTVSMGSWS